MSVTVCPKAIIVTEAQKAAASMMAKRDAADLYTVTIILESRIAVLCATPNFYPC